MCSILRFMSTPPDARRFYTSDGDFFGCAKKLLCTQAAQRRCCRKNHRYSDLAAWRFCDRSYERSRSKDKKVSKSNVEYGITLDEIERTSTHGYGSDEIKIDGETYKITNKIGDEELDEYLKILNAHNIQKIKTYVKFFFIIAVIAIIITIAAILPTISTIMQMIPQTIH